MLDQLVPGLGLLGLGGLLGYAVGIAFKSAAKTIGCLLGVLFILLQVLAYYHVINIDWGQLAHHARPAGQIAETGLERFWHVVTYNLPFGGGFAVGLALGLRRT